MVEIERTDEPPAPLEPAPAAPIPCTVPALHGLSLHAAKARLRAAHCAIGQVRLAAGATAGKGKVVKQFRAAGTELAAGAPVAVKLGVAAELGGAGFGVARQAVVGDRAPRRRRC